MDELGFLVLLGALSDRLYPAINTIMTRARYLVFVPAIFRHIEERRLAKHRPAERVSRDFQYELRNALLESDPRERGVIGVTSGRDIERPPSNIYWNALADLGIATSRISEAGYLELLSRGHNSTGGIKDDDGIVHPGDEDSFWDRVLPTSQALHDNGEFPNETTFRLTWHEARALQTYYAKLRPDGGTSLLSHILSYGAERPKTPVDFPFPWRIPALPGDLVDVTEHARLLSLFASGATLQYHALLFKEKGTTDPGTREAFSSWWKYAHDELNSWNLRAFAALPCVKNASRLGDVGFLAGWRDAVVRARSGVSAYGDEEARELLRRREIEMRGPKARLRSRYHLRTWKDPVAYDAGNHFALNYRHDVGKVFAVDIIEGLRRGRH